MKKIFVLDTNVLLYDASSIFSFEDNDIIIPLIVLEELDTKKSRPGEVGRNARQSARNLDELRKDGSLHSGVKLSTGGLLKILTYQDVFNENVNIPDEINGSKPDHIIIAMTKFLHQDSDQEVILVTKDINVRVQCDVVDVPCEDYRKHRVLNNLGGLYPGVARIDTTQEIVDEFYVKGSLNLVDNNIDVEGFFPNQFLVIKDKLSGQGSIIAKYRNKHNDVRPIVSVESAWGLRPRNKEQKFALDLLFDDDIKLVTLTGKAGCGKTLLAVAAGLEQVIENGKYTKLVVTRPVISLGNNDIGFLPGTLEEKMEPWIAPIKDNLKHLFGTHDNKQGEDTLNMMFERGTIEVEALSFIRGRSIPNVFMIIDEAQNLSAHELKTIITRVGENTKIVLTGDLEQIDNDYVDSISNGLAYCVERFKEHEISGHITLIKGERSELATLAADIL